MSDRSNINLSKLRRSPLVEFVIRWSRSWQVGSAIAVFAGIFVFSNWRSVEWSGLYEIAPELLTGAAIGYGGALMVLGLVVSPGRGRRSLQLFGSGLAAQLLKYAPGTIWQGQRLYSVGGASVVAQFAGTIFVAAGLGLVVSGASVVGAIGVVAVVGTLVAGHRLFGSFITLRIGLFSVMVAAGVGVSGALIGKGLGLDAISSGRDVVGAWGLGALTVPVPAGLGVRELYLSLATSGSDAVPQLAVAHRALTLVMDVMIGIWGLSMSWKARPRRDE